VGGERLPPADEFRPGLGGIHRPAGGARRPRGGLVRGLAARRDLTEQLVDFADNVLK